MIKELPDKWKKQKEKKENDNKRKSNDPQQDKHILVPLEEKTISPLWYSLLINQTIE